EVRQAVCSDLQFVNSGATGKVCGRTVELRSSSTGDPTRWIADSRLSKPMTSTTSCARTCVQASLLDVGGRLATPPLLPVELSEGANFVRHRDRGVCDK